MTAQPNFKNARWFKSSRSQGGQDTCVETAFVPGFAGVQDTKDRQRNDRLVFASNAWSSFVNNVKAGRLDR